MSERKITSEKDLELGKYYKNTGYYFKVTKVFPNGIVDGIGFTNSKISRCALETDLTDLDEFLPYDPAEEITEKEFLKSFKKFRKKMIDEKALELSQLAYAAVSFGVEKGNISTVSINIETKNK